MKALKLVLFILLLSGCVEYGNHAPVEEADLALPVDKSAKIHRVEPGDTLYAVAFRYDKDYRELALINGLVAPYDISNRQTVLLKPDEVKNRAQITVKTRKKSYKSGIKTKKLVSKGEKHRKLPKRVRGWRWPIKGQLASSFAPSQRRKGIRIKGRFGQVVYPAASGVVAYSGSGLRGYGNLIIIKHSDDVLTAYAYNDKRLVKEGQWVTPNKPIATVGRHFKNQPMLHFEIRQAGKPRNPLRYLPKKRV